MLDHMDIPERYLQKINPLIAHARSLVEKGDTLAALAFVGNLETNQVIPVVVDNSSDESKDGSARAIRMTSEMLEADFVFQIHEAWTLPALYLSKYAQIIEKYGAISQSPHAVDVAAFSLETIHGTWLATMPFKAKPPSKKRRTFGPLVFTHSTHVEGRFADLLSKKDNNNESGSLH